VSGKSSTATGVDSLSMNEEIDSGSNRFGD